MSNRRRGVELTIRRLSAALLAAALTLSWQAQASAHHGWGHFDTGRPLHVGGEVVAVRWGNPHPEVHLRLDRGLPVPDGLASMPIPTELEEIGGRDVLRVTRPYEGASRDLHLILAPTSRLEAWGMPDEVSKGEQIRAVGYVSRDDGQEFRPELLIREDGRAIRQRSVALPESPVADTMDEGGEHSSDGGSDSNGFLIAGALVVPFAAVAIYAVTRRSRRGAS